MARRWKQRRTAGHESGQSLVEFAMVVPLLALVLFALTELGFMLNDQVQVINAARNGARVAATTNGSSSLVKQAVTDSLNAPIRCVAGTPTITSTPDTNLQANAGQVASWTVTVNCVYTPLTPLGPLFAFFGKSAQSTYTISQSATMRDQNCYSPTCP